MASDHAKIHREQIFALGMINFGYQTKRPSLH